MGEQEIFIADGPHQILQQALAGSGAVRLEQLLVGEEQDLAGGGCHHRDRAVQAGTAQHVTKHAPRPHMGDGDPCPARCRAVGLDASGQHNADPAAGGSGLHQRLAPAITADAGPQLTEQGAQFPGRDPGKKRGGL